MLALEGVRILDLSKVIGITAKLSDVPGKVRTLSPLPGEQNNEILQKLGYKQKEIENLRQEDVIC